MIKSIFSLIFTLTCTYAFTAKYTWNGSVNSNWNNCDNWSPSMSVPSINDTIIINASGFSAVLDQDRSIGYLSTTACSINLNGCTLTVNGTGKLLNTTLSNGNLFIWGDTSYFNSCSISTYTYCKSNNIILENNTFTSNCTFIKTGSAFALCFGGNTFYKSITFKNEGNNVLRLANTIGDTFYDTLKCVNTSTFGIQLSYAGSSYYNYPIIVSSTFTGSIAFGSGGGTSYLSNSKSGIFIGSEGFNSGELALTKVQQSTGSAFNCTLSGSAKISFNSGNIFNVTVSAIAPSIYLSGSIFNSSASFTHNGSVASACYGGNTFNSDVTFINSGSAYLRLASFVEDIFNGDATFSSTGSSCIDVAYIGANKFNGNIYVNSSGSSTGINFGVGQGTSTLASGKELKAGSVGFTSGNLVLYYFTQIGTTSQSIGLGSSSALYLYEGTQFNGGISMQAGSVFLDQVTFNKEVAIFKTGNSSNNMNGGNIFNSILTLANYGTGKIKMATLYADDFNGTVSFMNASTGSIVPAYSGINTFAGDILISSASTITFGSGGGTVSLNKAGSQTISGNCTLNLYHLDISTGSGLVSIGTNIILNNTASKLTLGARALDLNSYMLTVENTASTAISYSTGYVISEDVDNTSKVKWNISSTTGSHVVPFGKSDGTQIPFTFNLTTGNAGYVTLSTYPTAAANTPYPTSPINVSHFNNSNGTNMSSDGVDRFWQIDVSGTTAKANLTFTYANAEIPVSGEASLKPIRFESLSNKWCNATSTYSNNPSANTVSVTGVSTFSPWAIVKGDAPLPVEFISFDGEVKNSKVLLSWSTASEINNDYFSVERSMDATNWTNIGNISGAGNSNIVLNYEFADEQPLNGVSYYRVKQTDYNGSYDYSDIIAVNNSEYSSKEISIENLFFNTSKIGFDIHNLEKEQYLSIHLHDISGKLIFSKEISTNNIGQTTSISGFSIAPGYYIISIQSKDGENLFCKKHVIQ